MIPMENIRMVVSDRQDLGTSVELAHAFLLITSYMITAYNPAQ